MSNMTKVRYIGNKPKKNCSSLHGLEHITTVWNGRGDVQEVHDSVARLLLQPQYKDIWEKVDDAPAPAPVATPPAGAPGGKSSAPLDQEEEDEGDDEAKEDAEAQRRLREIVSVIPQLKDEDFNQATKLPKLKALEALLGRKVTQLEAKAAMDAIKAHVGQASSGGVPE